MTAHIRANFVVTGGATADDHLDVDGLTGDEIAALIWEHVDVDTTLCWSCSGKVIDPEPDGLEAFTVDGVDYERDQDGHWQPATQDGPAA